VIDPTLVSVGAHLGSNAADHQALSHAWTVDVALLALTAAAVQAVGTRSDGARPTSRGAVNGSAPTGSAFAQFSTRRVGTPFLEMAIALSLFLNRREPCLLWLGWWQPLPLGLLATTTLAIPDLEILSISHSKPEVAQRRLISAAAANQISSARRTEGRRTTRSTPIAARVAL
jgi:hypothetical protein